MEVVDPGLDEEDEVEQDLDEVDEMANPGGSQDPDEVNEAPVVASAADMPGFSQNARTAYVDGKNDPIALACKLSSPAIPPSKSSFSLPPTNSPSPEPRFH